MADFRSVAYSEKKHMKTSSVHRFIAIEVAGSNGELSQVINGNETIFVSIVDRSSIYKAYFLSVSKALQGVNSPLLWTFED